MLNKKIRKVLFLFVTVFVLIFALCGCTNQSYEIKVNDDDSCDILISVIADVDNYNLISSYGINTDNKIIKKESSSNKVEQCDVLFQEVAGIFYNKGFDIEPVSDAVQVGFNAKKHYESIASLNDDINNLYKDKIIGLNIKINKTSAFISNNYSVKGTLDYYIDPDWDIPDNLVNSLDSVLDGSSLSANLYLSLPGKIDSCDGNTSTDTITWTSFYKKGSKETIPVNVSSSSTNAVVAIVIVFVVLIVLVVCGIFSGKFIRKFKNKHRTHNY